MKKVILDKLSIKDFAILDNVVKETKEDRRIVLKAFYDLEKEGKGKVKFIEDVGVVFDVGFV